MSGNKNSGNRSGRSSVKVRASTVAPRSPGAKAAKRAAGVELLDAVPAAPDNPLFDKRARVIWRRLGNVLLQHRMLTPLDLYTMEWVVVAWRSTELNAGNRAATVPANAVRVIAGLKELGLTKTGRVVGANEDDEPEQKGSPFQHLFVINGGKKTTERGGAGRR